MKQIFFLIDRDSFTCNTHREYTNFTSTSSAISRGEDLIFTTSIINLSFDLLDLGYDIYLCKNGKSVQIKPHMPELEKDLRKEHNLIRLFLAGVFDRCFE